MFMGFPMRIPEKSMPLEIYIAGRPAIIENTH